MGPASRRGSLALRRQPLRRRGSLAQRDSNGASRAWHEARDKMHHAARRRCGHGAAPLCTDRPQSLRADRDGRRGTGNLLLQDFLLKDYMLKEYRLKDQLL